MGKIYELSLLKSLKEEVSESMKKTFKIDGVKKTADYLGIDDGYAREIAGCGKAPFRNLERCVKAIRMTNAEHYYAVVVPYSFAVRYKLPEDGLQIFSCRLLDMVDAPGNYFESELFDVDNNLYRNCLRYWRYHVYNGLATISDMCELAGLSDRTVLNALHLNLSPKCSTIQKLLGVYGCRVVILKSPNKLSAKRVKIKY